MNWRLMFCLPGAGYIVVRQCPYSFSGIQFSDCSTCSQPLSSIENLLAVSWRSIWRQPTQCTSYQLLRHEWRNICLDVVQCVIGVLNWNVWIPSIKLRWFLFVSFVITWCKQSCRIQFLKPKLQGHLNIRYRDGMVSVDSNLWLPGFSFFWNLL